MQLTIDQYYWICDEVLPPPSLLCDWCITTTAGAYNHGHPLLVNSKTHSRGQPEPHKIHKRQGDSNRDNCDVVVHDELCTNGYYQDTVNVYQRCNKSYLATEIQAFCIPSFMGGYCLRKQQSTLERNVTRICGSTSSTCSQECRDVLISTRSELGCCIQSAYRQYCANIVQSHPLCLLPVV